MEAVRTCPVKINSLARAIPINRTNRWVPPAPGIIPKEVSGNPTLAMVLDATRMSVAKANSKPPPTATPSMTLMVGMGNLATRSNVIRSKCTHWSTASIVVMRARSCKSAPAENTRDDDVNMTHREEGMESS